MINFTSLKFLASASLALLLVGASSYARVVVSAALLMSLLRKNECSIEGNLRLVHLEFGYDPRPMLTNKQRKEVKEANEPEGEKPILLGGSLRI